MVEHLIAIILDFKLQHVLYKLVPRDIHQQYYQAHQHI